MRPDSEAEVVVVGGGATGAGVLRDLAMRGIRAMLVERGDFASGTSGRYHGLLHSGARYAASDPISARHCIEENAVLRRIAPAAIEATGGYFVASADDADDYVEQFPARCAAVGIDAERISLEELFHREALVNREIRVAYAVPDASLDPIALVAGTLASAREHGATAYRHRPVVGFERQSDGPITAVRTRDARTGEEMVTSCRAVICAAGVWSGRVAALAGGRLTMEPGKGSMLVLGQRVTRGVLNRLAPPGDGDILVPAGRVSIMGTSYLPVDDLEDQRVTRQEVDRLLADARRLVPSVSERAVSSVYAGIRPLYDASESGAGTRRQSPGDDSVHGESDREPRQTRRGHQVVDHGERDGVHGLWSVIGGKLTTQRLMARDVVDAVGLALGNDAPCRTGDEPLPESAEPPAPWPGTLGTPIPASGTAVT